MKLDAWEKRDDSKSHRKEGEGERKKKKKKTDDHRADYGMLSIEQESLRIGAGGGEGGKCCQ